MLRNALVVLTSLGAVLSGIFIAKTPPASADALLTELINGEPFNGSQLVTGLLAISFVVHIFVVIRNKLIGIIGYILLFASTLFIGQRGAPSVGAQVDGALAGNVTNVIPLMLFLAGLVTCLMSGFLQRKPPTTTV